jgi:hypothetical protein
MEAIPVETGRQELFETIYQLGLGESVAIFPMITVELSRVLLGLADHSLWDEVTRGDASTGHASPLRRRLWNWKPTSPVIARGVT